MSRHTISVDAGTMILVDPCFLEEVAGPAFREAWLAAATKADAAGGTGEFCGGVILTRFGGDGVYTLAEVREMLAKRDAK